MNKRQFKKFNKKLCHKTYDEYRYTKIVKEAYSYLQRKYPHENLGHIAIIIAISKKGKHYHSVKALTNLVPKAVKSGSTNNENSINFEFSCNKLQDTPIIEEKASTLLNMYRTWMEGVSNG